MVFGGNLVPNLLSAPTFEEPSIWLSVSVLAATARSVQIGVKENRNASWASAKIGKGDFDLNIDNKTSAGRKRVTTPVEIAYLILHGETEFQPFIASCAHATDLSSWHDVHGFGI